MKNKIIEVQATTDKTNYSYSAKNESFLDGLLIPYVVRPLLKVFPYSIPANFITIFSNTLVFLSFLIAMQATRGTHYLWFLIPVLVFVYVIGDCADGEQARRTKTGSPLGEFLDHFLDTFVTGVLMISIIASYDIKNPFVAYSVLFISYVTQATTFWEKFKMHKMHFGKFSSTETILSLTLITTLAYFKTIRDAVSQTLGSFGFIQNSFLGSCSAICNLTVMELIMLFMTLFALINIVGTLIRSGGASIRYWMYILFTATATIIFACQNVQYYHIPFITLSLLNINYISSLLVSIVMKKNDSYPDFILPVVMVVLFSLGVQNNAITIASLVYVLLLVVVRAIVFFSKHKQYWLWKNPKPEESAQ